MKFKKLQLIMLTCFVIIIAETKIEAQVFTGFSAFKELIEYEGQRYLMENIYQISSEGSDKLKIEKTIKEVDSKEGFMLVLTSYTFNGKSGVVITSFNSTSFSNTQHQFVNVHLTNTQYEELYNSFKKLEKYNPAYDEHILNKYNDRLIVDVNNDLGIVYFTLWVDNYSRHTFTPMKWDRAFKRHQKFTE